MSKKRLLTIIEIMLCSKHEFHFIQFFGLSADIFVQFFDGSNNCFHLISQKVCEVIVVRLGV